MNYFKTCLNPSTTATYVHILEKKIFFSSTRILSGIRILPYWSKTNQKSLQFKRLVHKTCSPKLGPNYTRRLPVYLSWLHPSTFRNLPISNRLKACLLSLFKNCRIHSSIFQKSNTFITTLHVVICDSPLYKRLESLGEPCRNCIDQYYRRKDFFFKLHRTIPFYSCLLYTSPSPRD